MSCHPSTLVRGWTCGSASGIPLPCKTLNQVTPRCRSQTLRQGLRGQHHRPGACPGRPAVLFSTAPSAASRQQSGHEQANAVADKILDLRKCSYVGKDLSKKVLSGALLVDSDLSKTKLIETVLTKVGSCRSSSVHPPASCLRRLRSP